jgi:hypothetical protein
MSNDPRAVVVEVLSGPADGVILDSRHEPGEEFSLGGIGEEVDVAVRALADAKSVRLAVSVSDTLRVVALGDFVVTVDGRKVDAGGEIVVGQIVKVGVTELLVKRIGETKEGDIASDAGPATTGDEPATPGTYPTSGVVEFYPEDLLSKFGFGDGDMLYDLIDEHDLGVDHQDLLVAVVERFVVPRLDQVVTTYVIGTSHNPIRADSIDGVKADYNSTLTPDVIEVPVADIIRVARTLPPAEEEEEEEEGGGRVELKEGDAAEPAERLLRSRGSERPPSMPDS